MAADASQNPVDAQNELHESRRYATVAYALVSGYLNSPDGHPGEHSCNFGAYLGPPVTEVHCQSPQLTAANSPSLP
jgi:hypothetical protein